MYVCREAIIEYMCALLWSCVQVLYTFISIILNTRNMYECMYHTVHTYLTYTYIIHVTYYNYNYNV